MNKPDKNFELEQLILQKLDGTISRSDYEKLIRILQEDTEAAAYYIDFTMLYVSLSEPGKITFGSHVQSSSQNYYNSLLALLAENEKIASTVDIPETKIGDELQMRDAASKKQPLRPVRQISPLNLWTAIGAIAALIFVVIYPRLIPEKVAVLTDSIDAVWSDNRGPVHGDPLYDNGKHFVLRSGLAKIAFDFGAEVILEGPSEFSLISEEKIFLHSGRIFARVPTRAVGFVVDTPSAGIIDLGTEFGVQVETDGSSRVHLFKGQASLMAGAQGARRESRILEKGSSRRVNRATSNIETISQDNGYVRQIESSQKFVWRGESLDLADMIDNEDKLESAVIGSAINPVNGKKELLAVPMPGENEGPAENYIQIPWNHFVDGVFVPDGGNGPVTVSSKGHRFASCPDTTGTYWTPISNGGLIAPNQEIPVTELILNGMPCGTRDNPAIFMHSNLGITFDLNAIRSSVPNVAITDFSAVCGISENTPKRFARADFWILIDGKLKFSKSAVDCSKPYPITIPISEQDEFLTLIVTDGGPQIDPYTNEEIRPVDCDWAVYLNPQLKLQVE